MSCCAYGCSKTGGRDQSDVRSWLRFCPVPKDRKLRRSWAHRIKRRYTDLTDSMVVCSDHFDDYSFTNFLEVCKGLNFIIMAPFEDLIF